MGAAVHKTLTTRSTRPWMRGHSHPFASAHKPTPSMHHLLGVICPFPLHTQTAPHLHPYAFPLTHLSFCPPCSFSPSEEQKWLRYTTSLAAARALRHVGHGGVRRGRLCCAADQRDLLLLWPRPRCTRCTTTPTWTDTTGRHRGIPRARCFRWWFATTAAAPTRWCLLPQQGRFGGAHQQSRLCLWPDSVFFVRRGGGLGHFAARPAGLTPGRAASGCTRRPPPPTATTTRISSLCGSNNTSRSRSGDCNNGRCRRPHGREQEQGDRGPSSRHGCKQQPRVHPVCLWRGPGPGPYYHSRSCSHDARACPTCGRKRAGQCGQTGSSPRCGCGRPPTRPRSRPPSR